MNSLVGGILKRVICIASLFVVVSMTAAAGSEEAKAPDRKSAPSEASANSAAGNQSDINELKRQLAEQQKQIEELRAMLQEQAKLIGYTNASAGARTQPPASAGSRVVGEVASMTPMIPSAAASGPPPVLPQAPKKEEAPEAAPLQLKIGSAYLTPVGFMDFTAAIRDTAPGSGIGTNFGSIPYRTPTSTTGNLSEFRLSPQNSRLGMRIDTSVKGARVIGYWESDFLGGLGNPPTGNVSVSSNPYAFRLRLFWVDVRKDKFELLGGQTWSLMTPGRKGISPLPGDLFFTQDVDVNYQLGLVWGRIPEFRGVYHPNEKLTMALALDNPEQYIGGSGGGGVTTLPANLATPYAAQVNNGTTVLNVPNMHPDIIAKVAFDSTFADNHALHIEFGGMERTFKVYNPLTLTHFTAAGWAVQANLNVEVVKGFRLVTNNYWSHGGGRYIFGQSPDLVVRNDGSLSLVHSGSTVSGFEYTHKNLLLYTYYGGTYIQRNAISAPGNGGLVGYGFTGSANSQNRSSQEGTFGLTNTFWRDPKYGALQFMAQYSYFMRNPWYVASGAPKGTHMNEIFLNLRYALPGAPPSPK